MYRHTDSYYTTFGYDTCTFKCTTSIINVILHAYAQNIIYMYTCTWYNTILVSYQLPQI